ncbi:MAG: flavin-nucleotide-binding protein [Nocardioides sp.]|nr:flavin-nucleotide-binding protein [Nocardioides sp.]
MTTPLSPTDRTRATRSRERMSVDRDALHAALREAWVGHLGLVVGAGPDAHPVVLPVALGMDLDGPDDGGSLYLHGSVAAGWLDQVRGSTVCVTVTHLDGLVPARSGMHHSMNYRSAVVIGAVREVTDADERSRALDLVVDHMVPGRAATLRPHLRKELAATVVLAVPLVEASLKVRAGGPKDDPVDHGKGVWSGHVPVRTVLDPPVPDEESVDLPVPSDLADLLAARGGGAPA